MADHGEIFWNELTTDDPDSAKAFYAGVMGWEMLDGPMPNGEGRYIVAKKGDKNICGIFPAQGEHAADMPNRWMTYLAVSNVEEAVSKVAALGGQVTVPPFPIPGVGKFAMIKDPTGADVGLAEPDLQSGE